MVNELNRRNMALKALVLLLALLLVALQTLAQQRPPIIDMHLHAYPIGSLHPPGTPHPLTGWPSPESDEVMRGENLAALERHNIVLAVTSGCPFELVRRWKESAPGRIVAAPYIGGGPACWPSVDALREAQVAGHLGALGEFGLQYQGLTLSSPEAEPYLALAEELGLPVGVHSGRRPPGTMYRCCPDFRVALGNPLLIEEALARHPGLRVYIMHAGYPFLAETIALLHAHPQVYADLSAINWILPRDEFHAYLRGLVRAGFSSRLMFGSDQMIWPDAIGAAIEGIESADFLTGEQKRGIFYDNAARFLRLSEEEIARHQVLDREEHGRSGSGQCLTKTTLSERLRFADIDRARELLGRSDEWARQLSAFDRGVRQRTLEPTNTRGFLEFVSGEAVAWTDDEQLYWKSLVDQLSEALEGLNLDIPDAFMVKTTGLEEFDAVYVRNRSIIFPQGRVAVAGDVRRDFFLLAHELFHLLSLEYPARRDELYALLGFRRFAGLEYPAELEDRRLSNPMYGSRYEYVLTVQAASGPVDVTPAYQAAVPLEEFIAISEGGMSMGAFFEVIDFVLLPVDTGTRAVLRDGSGYPIIYRYGDTDWIERMQRNSSYIIHPDEQMAENFALLMEWRRSGTVPESVPGGPGEGFPVNDIGLLEEIQKVLTAGCRE
jgi:uncharacterized protein